MRNKKTRLLWLDAIKGFAILLVVLLHILAKLTIAQGNSKIICRYFFDFLCTFCMPLFLALSGYAYEKFSKMKIDKKVFSWRVFLGNKAIELLIPYFFFSVVWGMKIFAGSRNTIEAVAVKDLLLIPIVPMGYLWYIYVLFFLLVIAVLTRQVKNKLMILLFTILYFMISVIAIRENIIALVCANGLFFFIGIEIGQLEKVIFTKRLLFASGLLFIVSEIIFLNVENSPFRKLICGILGILFFIILFEKYIQKDKSLNHTSSALCVFGKNSMYIYLLHQPIISIFRTIAMKLQITNALIWFIIFSAGSALVMYIIYKLACKVWWIDFFFVPNKYWKVRP